ncbi:MAG: response regulator, partial [Candidatus Zixiibacteriota bacterium]
LQFLRYLKSTIRYSKIPVIMCTALHDISSVAKSLEHGAIDYIVKPVEATVFKAKVAKALERGIGSVLIVCEDKVEMGILVRTIDREGFRCISCAHDEDVWNILESQKIAIVVAELLLPGISGFELLVRIKEKYPKLPVVLVADSHSERAREEIIAAGADSYLVKPFTNTDITRRIASLVK